MTDSAYALALGGTRDHLREPLERWLRAGPPWRNDDCHRVGEV